MPEFIINGIPVIFPFEPYEVQKNYMEKVIECLQNGTNGVLESPTGTGKTLSLLCSTLGWLLFMKSKLVKTEHIDQLPEMSNAKNKELTPEQNMALLQQAKKARTKIIYASRTHSQLSQAMQELKNTSYNFMRAIVLGSREQLCIHPDVSKLDSNATKTNLCREKVKARSCSFYNRVEQVKGRAEVANTPILDIEDLVTVGTRLKACPYYLAKEMVDRSDILFMPYNYLLDPKARKANQLDIENGVIILDEAHNVEKMCEESGSTQLKSSDVALAIEDATHILNGLLESGGNASNAFDEDKGDNMEFTLDDVVLLKELLLAVEKSVDEIPIMFSKGGTTHPGTYIFDLLEKANIKFTNVVAIVQMIAKLTTYITTMSEKNKFLRRGTGLQALGDFLEIVFAGSGADYRQSIEKCFRVHIEPEETKPVGKSQVKRNDRWISTKKGASDTVTAKANAKIINFWCFNPGFGMRQLLCRNIRSVILTSGTLAPINPLVSELNLKAGVCLENPHIIDRSQVYVRVVPHGPDGMELNSSYTNRDNPQYLASLGRTVLSFCPVIQGGLLVFFPSYPLLNRCSEHWQSSGIWAQIQRIKPIFVEPRGKSAFTITMTEYYAKLAEPSTRGAIFMAVCRGKVSEGLDFADINGRAVLITGLPFPPMLEPRVMLKKQYLDINRTRENELISGNEWYALEASRAVNQAIGRVIRHKDDYGAILLCDSRFQQQRQKAQLSTWIHQHLREERTNGRGAFGMVVGELARFFRNLEKSLPPPRIREIKPESIDLGNPSSRATFIKPERLSDECEKKFELGDYLHNNATESKPLADGKFLEQLGCSTSTLNLGDKLMYTASTESGLHKRKPILGEQIRIGDEPQKKRRVLIVPTDAVKYPSAVGTQETDTVVVKQEMSDVSDEAENSEPPRTAPVNKVDFLRAVKMRIVPEKYKLFLQAFGQYMKDSEFPSFMEKLVSCLGGARVLYLLRGMRRFLKEQHKVLFDERMAQLEA